MLMAKITTASIIIDLIHALNFSQFFSYQCNVVNKILSSHSQKNLQTNPYQRTPNQHLILLYVPHIFKPGYQFFAYIWILLDYTERQLLITLVWFTFLKWKSSQIILLQNYHFIPLNFHLWIKRTVMDVCLITPTKYKLLCE